MLFDNCFIYLLSLPTVLILLRVRFATCDDGLHENLSNLQRFMPTMSTNSYIETQDTNRFTESANDSEISTGSVVTVNNESLKRLEQLIKTLIRTYMKLFMVDSQRTVETTLLSATRFNDLKKAYPEQLAQYRLNVPNGNLMDAEPRQLTRPPSPSMNVNRRQDYRLPTTNGISRHNPQMAGRLESILPFGFGSNDSTTGTSSKQSPQMTGQSESILPFGFGSNDYTMSGTVSGQGPKITGQWESILPLGFGSNGDGESGRGRIRKSGPVSFTAPSQTQQQKLQTQNLQIPMFVDHSDTLVSQPMNMAKMSIPSVSDVQFPNTKSSQSTMAISSPRQIPATLYVSTKDGVPMVEGMKIDKKIQQFVN